MDTTAKRLEKITVVPHFMRLHEWIALEQGYYEAEGLAPELKDKLMTAALVNANGEHGRGEQPDYAKGSVCTSSACEWGVIRNAGAGHGKVLKNLYGVAPYAIYVRPSSGIRRLTDLRDKPVGVMLRAGSHFTSLKTLELCMGDEHINIKGAGGPSSRLDMLLRGEVAAATLLDPEIQVAEEMGLKRLAMGEFRTLFYITEGMDSGLIEKYLAALKRADIALRESPEDHMHLWEKNMRPEIRGKYDTSKFGLGELLFFEEYPKSTFDDGMKFAKKWGLTGDVVAEDYTQLTA